jgi:glycosyltransferase involved in cell wall biosynthesis
VRFLYSHRVGTRDGQGLHIEELVEALREAGHEVVVVGPALFERADFGGESGLIQFARSRLPKVVNEFLELAYNLPAYFRLRRAYNSFRPDIIYERYNLFYLAGTMLSRRTGTPLLLEVNAPLADERERFSGLGFRQWARWLEKLTWRNATYLLTVTRALKDIVVTQSGVAPDRIGVIQNAINVSHFAVPARARKGDEPVVLGFLGFVREWHGLDRVIAELARYGECKPVRLIIAGEGPAKAALERQAKALGLADRVQFTGLVARADIPALVNQFDVALQPSVVPYASPLKIFEYMACECAIVAPDSANIREVLTDGATALLFDPHDQSAMWKAIARLLDDPALRERLGVAARSALLANGHTWARNADRVIEIASCKIKK